MLRAGEDVPSICEAGKVQVQSLPIVGHKDLFLPVPVKVDNLSSRHFNLSQG
jgi:hypothetical protein